MLWMSEAWGRDAFTVLTHIAANTERIKLAPGIVSIHARSPASTAQSMASLDQIAGGRTVLGLGVGSEKLTVDWHGGVFDHPIGRMREYAQAVREIFAGERVEYEGRFYQIRGLKPLFRPIQERLPIYLAALGPKMVALAGEIADGWFPNFMSPDGMPQYRAHLAAGARRAGRALDEVDIYIQRHVCADPDAEYARRLARQGLAFLVAGYGPFYRETATRLGFGEEVTRIMDLWATDRPNIANGVSDAFLEALTIAGTPQRCRDRLLELEGLGLAPLAIAVQQTAPLNVIRNTIEAFAPKSFS